VKKILLLFVILSLILSINLFRISRETTVNAANKGNWVFVERKLIDLPQKKAPFSTEISGEEGKKIITAKYENNEVKEIAVVEWGWTVPPKTLNPGNDFEMVQTGLIKTWKTTHFFSGTMFAKIQRYGASCCEIDGPDLGLIRMDYTDGDAIGVKKEVRKIAKIPNYGDLDSSESNRIQFLVKLQQSGAEFQWIYIYEWKEIAISKKIEIELKIGSKLAFVNGTGKNLDSAPFIENGRTYVPFRFLGESFGAVVNFTTNPKTNLVETVQYKLNDLNITLYINKNETLVNNKILKLDSPPIMRNNRVMVPVRFISENLSAEVIWNPANQTITIRKD
jgi:hypothetical protein